MRLDFDAAVAALKSGGVIGLPTETLFGLGGCALDPAVAARVIALKGRGTGKGLPLIAADFAQVERVADLRDKRLAAMVQDLAERFWPGPLTVVLPAAPGVPALVYVEGPSGPSTAVRVCAHPETNALCAAAGFPLIATSFNKTGSPATADPDALDPAVLAGTDGVFFGAIRPAGGAPSTLVQLDPVRGGLVLLREGAVSRDELTGAGFLVLGE